MADLWTQWKLAHDKGYRNSLEEQQRFQIFTQNYIDILHFNQEHTNTVLGLNKFADLTSEEFKVLYTGLLPPKATKAATNNHHVGDLPPSVDWRAKGAVNPVKNQGACGSCWAFSAVGPLEGLYFIETGKLLKFSEQMLVDCVDEDSGCGGGLPTDAYDWTAKNGIETEEDYPYKARDQKCAYDPAKAYHVNTGYENVTVKNATALKAALVQQTVSVGIQADQLVFQFYVGGVIQALCGDDLNHGVVVVGYDKINGIEAFIVRNSWSANWGVGGYVYISTNPLPNDGNGVCGILAWPSIPTNH